MDSVGRSRLDEAYEKFMELNGVYEKIKDDPTRTGGIKSRAEDRKRDAWRDLRRAISEEALKHLMGLGYTQGFWSRLKVSSGKGRIRMDDLYFFASTPEAYSDLEVVKEKYEKYLQNYASIHLFRDYI
jgi:hypothetical protein